MDSFHIKGNNKFSGSVRVSGAKNAVLPLMTACLIYPGKYKLNNVPNLADTRTMIKLLEIIGCKTSYENETLHIDSNNCDNPNAPYELVKTMRASFYVLGPLISRFSYSKVSLPGGCAWGPRPVDFHIKALKEMSVDVQLKGGNIVAKGKPKGAEITFSKKSVGATGNVVMAAARAQGITVINNSSLEPEIQSLCEFLQKIGVEIDGLGTDQIIIKGNDSIEIDNMEYDIIPDRIEAGTFLIAAAAVGGDLKVLNCKPGHLEIIINLLKDAGCSINIGNNFVEISSPEKIKAVDMETLEYPGFPTDLQAQWMALMCIADGTSTITENIYNDRFTHIAELNRFGADISLQKNIATISGVDSLYGAPVMSTDIRASASLIIAALMSSGESSISRIYHIDRGYDKIEDKLSTCGMDIKRERNELF